MDLAKDLRDLNDHIELAKGYLKSRNYDEAMKQLDEAIPKLRRCLLHGEIIERDIKQLNDDK